MSTGQQGAGAPERRPGIRKAATEAEERDEEPAPKTPAGEVQNRPAGS